MDADQYQVIASASTVPAGSHDDHDYDDSLSVHDDPPMEEGMLEKYNIHSIRNY